MFNRPKIAVDFGSDTLLLYSKGRGIVINEYSMVAVDSKTKEIIAIGDKAKEMVGRIHDGITLYQPIQYGVIANNKSATIVLQYFLKKTLPKYNFLRPDMIIVAPVNVNSAQKRAMIELGKNAGAIAVYVEKAPILAALGAGLSIKDSRGSIIVDIGSHTTEVAIISLGGIIASTSQKIGGKNIDEAIVNFIYNHYNLVISTRTAEDIKKKVVSVGIPKDVKVFEVKGRDKHSGLPTHARLQVEDINRVAIKEAEKILEAIRKVLYYIPPELSTDILDRGIILTGGSANLCGLVPFITKNISVTAEVAHNPEFCVIEGAGQFLDQIGYYKNTVKTKI